MKLNQPKVFKFVRKQYQTSEEVNPLKDEKRKIGEREGRGGKPLPVEEERLRKNLVFFNIEDHHKDNQIKNSSLNTPVRKELKEQHKNNNDIKKKKHHEIIQFDKKLSKVMMPDNFQKLKFIKKLESRLFSCLQKKKPHVYVKQLINQETLNRIFGKNPRRLSTSNTYLQKLDLEAQSVKKGQIRQPQKRKEKNVPRRVEKYQKKLKPKMKASEFFDQDSHESCFDIFKEPPIFQQSEPLNYNQEINFSEDNFIFDLRDYEFERDSQYLERKKIGHERQNKRATPHHHKQRDKYDLRNLKVPKLDILDREVPRNDSFFDAIKQVQEDIVDSDLLLHSGKIDQPSFFSSFPSNDQFEGEREDNTLSSWTSEDSFY